MKRIKLILLFTIMFISIISFNNIVKADDQLGKVSDLSGGASQFDGNTAHVELSYNELNLKWFKADYSIGRNADGYWVGYRIDAPSFIDSEEKAQKIGYHRRNGGATDWTSRSFMEVKDGEWYMTGWAQVTQQVLDKHEEPFVLYEAEFDWDGNGDYEQSVTIKINPKSTVLETDKKSTVTIREAGNGASDTETVFEIYRGTTLAEGLTETEKNTLDNIKNKEGFVTFYKLPNMDTNFELDKLETYTVFNPENDTIDEEEALIIAYFNAKTEEPPTQDTEEPPTTGEQTDNTPATGGIDIIGYVLATIVASATGIVLLSKKH